MGRTMLSRDVRLLELGKLPVKFLSWMRRLQVDDQPAADRGHRAGFWTGKLDSEVPQWE